MYVAKYRNSKLRRGENIRATMSLNGNDSVVNAAPSRAIFSTRGKTTAN